MVVRLSELLERIRPAGAPGAPSEGERLNDRQAADEIADVTGILVRFEAEADGEISAARERADQIRAGAERQLRRIRSDLPRAVADARAAGAALPARESSVELARISSDADDDIERLNTRAATELPVLVEAAMNVIREELALDGPRGRLR